MIAIGASIQTRDRDWSQVCLEPRVTSAHKIAAALLPIANATSLSNSLGMDALMHASERTRLQLALLEGSSSGWSARGSLNSKLAASSSPARRRCRSGGASSGRFVSIRRSRSVSSHWQQCQVTQEGESNKALNLAPSLKVDGAAVRRHPLPAPRCYSRSRGASLDDAAAAAVSASGAADSSLGGVAGSIQDLALDGFGSHWTAQAHDVDHRAAPSARGIDVEERQEEEGLGIVSFLKGKHILVTGATGFVAKGWFVGSCRVDLQIAMKKAWFQRIAVQDYSNPSL